MSRAESTRPAAAWRTFSARNFSISFSASFSLPSMAETFSGSSSGRPLTSSWSWATTVCSLARKLYASTPTRASMRRTPEPIEDSPSSFTRPSWAVLWTWVPPHSSLEKSPMVTTRTCSPYFSPNSAMAPWRLASSIGMTSAWTSSSRERTSLIFCSTSVRTAPGTAFGEPKSKRKRPGWFSEPAWAAVGPRASRRAWWVRWVAEWARAMARRRRTSMAA